MRKNLKFIKLAQLKNNNSELKEVATPGLAAHLGEFSTHLSNCGVDARIREGKKELGQNRLSQGPFINQVK